MKNEVFKIFLSAVLLCFTIIGSARPYAVLDGMHVLQGGCIFFHITVYEDGGTSNPGDDYAIGGGWVGTAGCESGGIMPNNNSILQGDLNFESFEESEAPDVSSFDYSDMGNATILEPLEDYELKVYPNPSNGLISIDLEDFQATSGFIYSLSGGVVKSFNVNRQDTNLQISLEGLTAGTYVIALTDGVSIVKTTQILE